MRAFLAVALAVTPLSAAAQSRSPDSIDEVRKEARLHLGGLYLSPSIQLKEIGVDTNVFNQAVDRRSDYTFRVCPSTTFAVPFARRALVTADVGSDLVWYAKYASERSVDPQVGARGELYLHRVTLFAENSYVNTRQRPNFEIDLRSRHIQNDGTAGLAYRFTPKLSLELAGVRRLVQYDADAFFLGTSLREVLNRRTTGGSATIRQRLTSLTTIAVRGEATADRFTYARQRDSDTVRVMPGLEFKPRALISGSAWVGFRRFTPKYGDLLPPFSGLVAQLGLSYTLLGSTTFGVNYNRDLDYSFESLEPYYVSNQVGAAVRRALGSHFDVSASADRYLYEYRQVGVNAVSRQDVTWNYVGTFGYRVGRSGRIGFGASYYDRASTTKNYRDYHVLRIVSALSYGF